MKSFKFSIGKAGRTDVKMDAMSLVDSRLLATANSGGGKSFLLRGLVEQVGAKIPTIVLDPEGEFSTLREKLDMVLVGSDGDIDPDPRSAALLCRKIIELRLSAVVDLYELRLHERRRFVREFLETLIDLPRKLWGPTFILIDEAHKFSPEKGAGQAESTDAVISLMSQGRKRGYGGCLVTQRLSKLHKDAVGECNNVMVGRCVQDVDLKRCGDILGLSNVRERNKLRSLKPGEFHGFGPAFEHDGILLFRSRPVETTHPDARTRHKLKAPAPSKAISKVLPELSDLPARAADEKATLEASQAEIRRLEREVGKLRKAPSVERIQQLEAEIERLQEQVPNSDSLNRMIHALKERDGDWERWVDDEIKATAQGILDEWPGLQEKLGEIQKVLSRMTKLGKPSFKRPASVEMTAKIVQDTPRARIVKRRTSRSSNGAKIVSSFPEWDQSVAKSQLTPSGFKILSALAQFPEGLDLKRLGIITGLATRGGSFNQTMAHLRGENYIEGGRGTNLKITDQGIEVVGEPEPLPTGPALLDHWKSKLRNKSAEAILDAFVEHESLSTPEIGEVTGLAPRGGSFNKAMARLRAMDLIRGRGTMHLNPDLAEAIQE